MHVYHHIYLFNFVHILAQSTNQTRREELQNYQPMFWIESPEKWSPYTSLEMNSQCRGEDMGLQRDKNHETITTLARSRHSLKHQKWGFSMMTHDVASCSKENHGMSRTRTRVYHILPSFSRLRNSHYDFWRLKYLRQIWKNGAFTIE